MSIENTHEGPARVLSYLQRPGPVFFVGIGGVMMSSLARLTAAAGHAVSGSDRAVTPVTEALAADGIPVLRGHDAAHLPEGCALTVYTVAVSPDNPELAEARRRGIPCVSRADYLGALMTAYRARIGVSGMHGKSTCTAMCAQILLDAGADPTVVSGAPYAPMGGAYRAGGRDLFLFEACEYMDSFLDFRPTIAVILCEEEEHLDYFKSMGQIRDSFARFASLTGTGGATIANADDADAMASARQALAAGRTGRLVTFGLREENGPDFTARLLGAANGCPRFEWIAGGKVRGTVALRVPGRHQVYNALAAAAAASVAGMPDGAVTAGLSRFSGVARRMEYRGEVNGAPVYDDYAHHPTEVSATLRGARDLLGGTAGGEGRIICVFQPHTYSRLALLYDRFLRAFDEADAVILLDVYAARETDRRGVSSASLARDLNRRSPGKALYCPDPADAAARLRRAAAPWDLVVVMGAGDVTRVTDALFRG